MQANTQNQSPNWSASMQFGELFIERKLTPIKTKIEQLIDTPEGVWPMSRVLPQAFGPSDITHVTGG